MAWSAFPVGRDSAGTLAELCFGSPAECCGSLDLYLRQCTLQTRSGEQHLLAWALEGVCHSAVGVRLQGQVRASLWDGPQSQNLGGRAQESSLQPMVVDH